MGRYTAGGVGRDIIAGAIAGAFGVWAMKRLDWKLYEAGGPERIRRTEAARPGGMDPAHAAAQQLAQKVGVDVGDPKDNPAGHALEWTIGMGMGALYGLLRGMSPRVAKRRGLYYGLTMWLLKDEVLNTVMGTAGPPLSYPWQDHARGAASHALFGASTDLITRVLSPWRDRVVIEVGPSLSERAGRLQETARASLEDLRQRSADTLSDWQERAQPIAEQVRRQSADALDWARERGSALAGEGYRRAEPYVSQASDRGASYAAQARDYGQDAVSRAADTAQSTVRRARRSWF